MTSSDLPAGLPADHLLLAIDEVVSDPVLDGVYDPRLASLSVDGTLVFQRWDVDAIFGTTIAMLDDRGLANAWSAVVDGGLFRDGELDLPGFAAYVLGGRTEIRVDDGTRSTRLDIAFLGSEGTHGAPQIPGSEMALRAAATRLKDLLRGMAGAAPWTPPALLLWWRRELPADWDATVEPWSVPIDLATAGRAIEHPVWSRWARFEGADADAIATVARTLPIDHLVTHRGTRYALNIRAIHPDELDAVPGPEPS